MQKKLLVLAALATMIVSGLGLGYASSTQAQTTQDRDRQYDRGRVYTRTIVLNGRKEVPANRSRATATAKITINTRTNALRYDITYRNLSSRETEAHIHGPARFNQNAAPLVSLPVGRHKVGTWSYPQNRERDILRGLTYINIHSARYPNGEIRGQIVP